MLSTARSPSPRALLEYSREHLRQTQRLLVDVQRARPRRSIAAAWHRRDQLEKTWADALDGIATDFHKQLDIEGAIAHARWESPPDDPIGGLLAGGGEPLALGTRLIKRLTQPRRGDAAVIESWPDEERRARARRALAQDGLPGIETRVLRDAEGRPIAIASVLRDGDVLRVSAMSATDGNGSRMLQEVAKLAGREGRSLELSSASAGSSRYYEQVGMKGTSGGRYSWDAQEAKEFGKSGGYRSPAAEEVRARLLVGAGAPTARAAEGAMSVEEFVGLNAAQIYLQMALTTSTVAGQTALEHMGLNKTWAWAHPRNMARDLFAVRGSKVVQNLYGEHLTRLQRMIVEATDPHAPLTVQQVSAKVKTEWPALQRYQVERIARTETAAVWTTTSMNAYQANGISRWESIVAHGPSIGIDSEEPCEQCVSYAVEVHSMGDDIPPWHPNCLPAGQAVRSLEIQGASKRWYVGETISIKTRGERSLTVTPNHPVYTSEGWIPAREIREGDHLICAGWSDRNQTIPVIPASDEQDIPPLIEDVFEALNNAPGVTRAAVPASPKDFHGDGSCDGEVDVVLTDRLGWDDRYAPVRKKIEQDTLVGRNVRLHSFFSLCAAHETLFGAPRPTHGTMCGCDLMRSLRRGHRAPSDIHGLASSAGSDAHLIEALSDRNAADTKCPSDGVMRLPTSISLDDVVHIERLPFAGHVYNLTSSTGWYAAGIHQGVGIVVANCRCEAIPLLRDEYGEWLPPQEPFTGGAEGMANIPVCGSVLALARKAQRARLVAMGTVLKQGASCLTPAPEPGESFGGLNFGPATVPGAAPITKDIADALRAEVSGWKFASLQVKQTAYESIGSALKDDVFGLQLMRDQGGVLKGLALYSETKQLLLAEQVLTAEGGGLKLLSSLASRAAARGEGLATTKPAITEKLALTLEHRGVKLDTQGRYVIDPGDIPKIFDIPKPAAVAEPPPVPTVPSGSAMGYEELEAQLTSANNRLSGLRTREKRELQRLDFGTGSRQILAEIRVKIAQEEVLRVQIKEQMLLAGGGRHVPTVVESPPPAPLKIANSLRPGGAKKEAGSSKLYDAIRGERKRSGDAEMKRRVAARLVARLERDPRWDAEAVLRSMNYQRNAYSAASADESAATQLVHNWAITSSDQDYRAVAIQMAIKEEFGLPGDVFPAGSLHEPYAMLQTLEQARELMDEVGASLRAFVRAQYEETQEALRALGVEEMTVYRGISIGRSPKDTERWGSAGLHEQDIMDNPAASWSVRWGVSKKFSEGVILRAVAPREAVLGTPLSGFGCANEFEAVVLNYGRSRTWALVRGHHKPTEAEKIAWENEKTALISGAPEDVRAAYRLFEEKNWEAAEAYSHKIRVDALTLRDSVRDLDRKIEGEFITIDKESELNAMLKKLVPSEPKVPRVSGKAPGGGGGITLERRLRNRITSLRFRLKHPPSSGWSVAQVADMEAKMQAAADELATLAKTRIMRKARIWHR